MPGKSSEFKNSVRMIFDNLVLIHDIDCIYIIVFDRQYSPYVGPLAITVILC